MDLDGFKRDNVFSEKQDLIKVMSSYKTKELGSNLVEVYK